MTPWIYAACGTVILLFAISALTVLNVAGHAANYFSGHAERRLVQLEFQNQVEAAVQYQAQISFWDATVAQLKTGGFSDKFVEDTITQWMWPDFNFKWMVFLDSGRNAVLSTREGRKVSPETSRTLVSLTGDLFEAAKQRYSQALRPAGKGWRIEVVRNPNDALTAPLPYIHVSDIRRIDGIMSIVVVQAVVPKSLEIAADDAKPTFLVSVKPITPKMLANMEHRLGVGDLHFGIATRDGAEGSFASVGSIGSGFPSTVFWTENAPLDFVWKTSAPVVAAICLLAGLTMGVIAFRFARTVGALRVSEANNRFLARHDGLTGLVNRAGLDEALVQAFAQDGAPCFGVICLDLDRFGHPAGDAVLKEVGRRFAGRAGGRGMVARMGGDEFVVLFDGSIGPDEALFLARGLVIDAQIPIPFDGTLLQVGASAGIGMAADHGSNPRELMAAADGALYAAKSSGRNCALMAEPSFQQRARAA
ncbi:diguanylate cyclase domain-containing protein [Pararhizobium sp.]|uniref:diguanylate cyclase domain-containing protein n=1 Tax=Pararhizobium sp. TaxID=1977563 RepID=UPI00271B0424|nr:diguanylate cyclase [Pararhizobium sp.]MDO9418936.1 diguanylate cyclase [Pararhizobium sp.]